jgi:hypothetical protein
MNDKKITGLAQATAGSICYSHIRRLTDTTAIYILLY